MFTILANIPKLFGPWFFSCLRQAFISCTHGIRCYKESQSCWTHLKDEIKEHVGLPIALLIVSSKYYFHFFLEKKPSYPSKVIFARLRRALMLSTFKSFKKTSKYGLLFVGLKCILTTQSMIPNCHLRNGQNCLCCNQSWVIYFYILLHILFWNQFFKVIMAFKNTKGIKIR